MHGTFPSGIPEYRSTTDFAAPWPCLAFAAMPVVVATAVALCRFGGSVSVGNILDFLAAAALAAPL